MHLRPAAGGAADVEEAGLRLAGQNPGRPHAVDVDAACLGEGLRGSFECGAVQPVPGAAQRLEVGVCNDGDDVLQVVAGADVGSQRPLLRDLPLLLGEFEEQTLIRVEPDGLAEAGHGCLRGAGAPPEIRSGHLGQCPRVGQDQFADLAQRDGQPGQFGVDQICDHGGLGSIRGVGIRCPSGSDDLLSCDDSINHHEA